MKLPDAKARAVALAVGLSARAALAVGGGGGGGPSGAAGGSGSCAATQGAPDLALTEINAGNFDDALRRLRTIVAKDRNNAGACNLLGHASRQLGDDKNSLRLNPRHPGALEHQGLLFHKIGKPGPARANPGKLQSPCGTCDDYMDLFSEMRAAGS